jgi:hypothetical protein
MDGMEEVVNSGTASIARIPGLLYVEKRERHKPLMALTIQHLLLSHRVKIRRLPLRFTLKMGNGGTCMLLQLPV